MDSLLGELFLKSRTSVPGIVVGNFAGDVVKDMSLGDTVGSMSTKPSHKAATVTQEATVKGGEGTTGEGELRCAVVGKKWVGVLKESDENKPMIDPLGRSLVEKY